jgi:predicted NUDIX family NTP pyrophosphohydrolase/SHS2 domain-containing protein
VQAEAPPRRPRIKRLKAGGKSCLLTTEVAMGEVSAGLLMYRMRDGSLECFLAHPGGPLFANKDDGAWSIPKGLVEPGEDPRQTAVREFEEETGIHPRGELTPLGSVRQKSGKIVHAWAFAGDWDPARGIRSNTFEMEWPPHSGRRAPFPEIDRAEFFSCEAARRKVNAAQRSFIDRLESCARPGSGACPAPAEDAAGLPDWLCPLDHTADIGFFLQAGSLKDLFARAAWAMFSIVTDPRLVRAAEREHVAVAADDRAALMVAWLSELNFRHISRRRLFGRFEVAKQSGTELEAEVYGEAIAPARHTIHTEIKAVTFHNLMVEKSGDVWVAQIIFDV